MQVSGAPLKPATKFQEDKMKVQLFTLLALFALALMAEPALAQNSEKPSQPLNAIARLLHLGPQARPTQAPVPGQDAVAQGLAKAKIYKYSSADYPGGGTNYVFDKNNTIILGDTAFASTLPSTLFGFTQTASTYALLSVPGSTTNTALGINTSGQIVGIYTDVFNAQHGLLLDTGGLTETIDDPSAEAGSTVVFDINDSGEMVGSYTDTATGVPFSFSSPDGVAFNNFNITGAFSTVATGVNAGGDIVGYWTDSTNVRHAFLNGTSIDFPLAKSTTAIGINDSGDIAGWFEDAAGNSHGFILSRGQFTQVDVAGASGTELTRIKNSGGITGVYTDSSGEEHGLIGR